MTKEYKLPQPFVSIIIPVFNNIHGLERTLQFIEKQIYSRDCFEVIVIDNGSEYSPDRICEEYSVIFLEEHVHLNSPYSARNRGLEIAKGEIVVLLDTTCAPDEGWLKGGVSAIERGADLVGGNVVFDVNINSSAGEIYDSLVNIKMKESIVNRNVAKTTNLFIRREVFNKIGWFPEGLRSGGDVRWTAKATRSGFNLVFGNDATVYILPRGFQDVLKKQWRVAKGQPEIWKECGGLITGFIKKGVLCFIPPDPRSYRKISIKEIILPRKKKVLVYLTAYFMRIVTGAGVLVGFYRIGRGQRDGL